VEPFHWNEGLQVGNLFREQDDAKRGESISMWLSREIETLLISKYSVYYKAQVTGYHGCLRGVDDCHVELSMAWQSQQGNYYTMTNNVQGPWYQFTWVDNNAHSGMRIAAGSVVVTGSLYNMALECQ
jgi:hypothetical protein